jgi:hypothetical protein
MLEDNVKVEICNVFEPLRLKEILVNQKIVILITKNLPNVKSEVNCDRNESEL